MASILLLLFVFFPAAVFAETPGGQPVHDHERSAVVKPAWSGVIDSLEMVRNCPPWSVYGRSFLKEKKVALTFDDGPYDHYTDEILDILKQYGVKATFFLVGSRMEEHPGVVKRIYAEGHALGLHAYRHTVLNDKSGAELYFQVRENQKVYDDILKIQPLMFRPPFGDITPGQVEYLFSRGIVTMLWSVNSYDSYPYRNSVKEIYQTVTDKVFPGAVVIFHDRSAPGPSGENAENTVKALPGIIEFLRGEGYRFYVLPELLKENNLPPE